MLSMKSCPRTMKELLYLLKHDCVITDFEYAPQVSHITSLMAGMNNARAFAKQFQELTETGAYVMDAVKSRNDCKGSAKETLSMMYAIFFFPLSTKRMERSRARNKFRDKKCVYAISEVTAKKVFSGELLLPEECVGKPMVLLKSKWQTSQTKKVAKQLRRLKRKRLEDERMAAVNLGKRRNLQTLVDAAALSSVSQRLPRTLLNDKTVPCRNCKRQLHLEKGMLFGTVITCPSCSTSSVVRFFPKPSSTVHL